MIDKVPFVNLLVNVDKSQSREIIVLSSWVRATPILLCHTGPALYPKGLYLGQPLYNLPPLIAPLSNMMHPNRIDNNL